MHTHAPGARKGSRRAVRPRRTWDHRAAAVACGVLVAGVAWAALVYAGIRFGHSARDGETTAWVFMAIASLGAVACLFLALMLGARAARMLGFTAQRPVGSVVTKGGKRSAGRRAPSRH